MKIYRSIDLGALELSSKIEDPAIDIHFEPVSDEELFNSGFDVIELSEQQNQNIIQKMTTLDWSIQSSKAIDAFVKVRGQYKPVQLGATAFAHYLESKHLAIDTSKNAVVIGNYAFLMSYAAAIGKLGFKKIYLISPSETLYKEQIEAVRKYLFNVELIQLSLDEMTNISELASLLVLDFELNENQELVDMLTYFNFLAENAIFFDLQNYVNDTLSLEAEKASLKVLNAVEFHTFKYHIVEKIFK